VEESLLLSSIIFLLRRRGGVGAVENPGGGEGAGFSKGLRKKQGFFQVVVVGCGKRNRRTDPMSGLRAAFHIRP